MVSMINILQHFFILRHSIFTITFRPFFPFFDLIFYELDKILQPKIKDKLFVYVNIINQTDDNNIHNNNNNNNNDHYDDNHNDNNNDNNDIFNFSLDESSSYDLDDIIGSNYKRRNSNPKKNFSSKRFSFNQCLKNNTTLFEDPESQLSKENDESIETEKICILDQISPEIPTTELLTTKVLTEILTEISTEISSETEISKVLTQVQTELLTKNVLTEKIPAEVLTGIQTEISTEEIPAEVSTEIPTEIPAEVSTEIITTEVPTEIPAETEIPEVPTEIPAKVPTEIPAETEIPEVPTEIPAEVSPISTEIPTEEVSPILTEIPTEVSPISTEIPTEVSPILTEIPTEVSPISTEIPTEVSPISTEIPTEVSTEISPISTEIPTEVSTERSPISTEIPTEVSPISTEPTEVSPISTEIPTEVSPISTEIPTEVSPISTAIPTEVSPKSTEIPTEVSPISTEIPTEISPISEVSPKSTEIPTEISPIPTEIPTEISPIPTEIPTEISPISTEISTVEKSSCEIIANVNDKISRSIEIEESIVTLAIAAPITTPTIAKDKRLERATPLSFNASIPIDIFIEICYHLPPTSLFSLMCTCKQFRFWLNSSVSYVTQDIWRTSRMKYLERIKLRPPAGMDELAYIRLTMLEQGCQFCGTKNETPKVYWAFRIRCCQECLRKRVTSSECLPKWAKSPVDISMLVPYENVGAFDSDRKIVVYWNSHLEQIRREYTSTPIKNRSAWIQKKQHWVSEFLKEVVKRERIDELCCKKQSLEDERIFRTLLDEFLQVKDERGQQKYIDKYVFQLPTYLEAQYTLKIPFMTNPWPNFINRLQIEYPKVMSKVLRLQQITETMLTLITSYVTLASDLKISSGQGYQIYLTDPVIDCLQWCPSFINPPYVKDDASIPWTEEYLIETLIPKLRKEARHLLKNPEIKRPGPFTSVSGCKNLIKNEIEDKDFFMCKLCWKSTKKLYNYEGICRHLTSGRHSIARIDDERMIEVDRDKIKKLLPAWFASLH